MKQKLICPHAFFCFKAEKKEAKSSWLLEFLLDSLEVYKRESPNLLCKAIREHFTRLHLLKIVIIIFWTEKRKTFFFNVVEQTLKVCQPSKKCVILEDRRDRHKNSKVNIKYSTAQFSNWILRRNQENGCWWGPVFLLTWREQHFTPCTTQLGLWTCLGVVVFYLLLHCTLFKPK